MIKRICIFSIALLMNYNVYALCCNHKLVQEGNSYISVIEKKCGELKTSESYSKKGCANYAGGNVRGRYCFSYQVDKISYKYNGMTHTLTFHDKVLKTIESCRLC